MKRKEKAGPKFRVGQVVRAKDGSYCRLITPYKAKMDDVRQHRLFDSSGYVYAHGGREGWYHVSELRPLTARESGQRQRKGKG